MNATPSTPPPLPPRRGSFPPVFLSAFIYPGIGQLTQGRRWAGGFFILLFTLPFLKLAAQISKIVVIYFNLAFNWRNAEEAPQDMGILMPFLVCVVLYAINVVDAVLAQRRAKG